MGKKQETLCQFFDFLIRNSVSPDALYVLHCVKENTTPVGVSSLSNLLKLKSQNYAVIETSGENMSPKITQKGEKLLHEVEQMFAKAKKKTAETFAGTEHEQRIKEYLEFFPKMKLPNGKPARVNPKNLVEPFVWFFQNYEYSWETVLKATEAYVNEFQKKRYLYMCTSQYFVRKQLSDKSWKSDLSDWCEMVKDDDYNPDNQGLFSEKVV